MAGKHRVQVRFSEQQLKEIVNFGESRLLKTANAMKVLASIGIKAEDKTYITADEEKAIEVSKEGNYSSLYLDESQYEVFTNFRFDNHINSESKALIVAVLRGVEKVGKEGFLTNNTAHTPPYDSTNLEKAILLAEELLLEEDRQMTPEIKAKFITAIYELHVQQAKDKSKKVDKEQIRPLLKAVG